MPVICSGRDPVRCPKECPHSKKHDPYGPFQSWNGDKPCTAVDHCAETGIYVKCVEVTEYV